jgi:hypothetical protein
MPAGPKPVLRHRFCRKVHRDRKPRAVRGVHRVLKAHPLWARIVLVVHLHSRQHGQTACERQLRLNHHGRCVRRGLSRDAGPRASLQLAHFHLVAQRIQRMHVRFAAHPWRPVCHPRVSLYVAGAAHPVAAVRVPWW